MHCIVNYKIIIVIIIKTISTKKLENGAEVDSIIAHIYINKTELFKGYSSWFLMVLLVVDKLFNYS